MVAIIGIAIGGILFLLRALVALIEEEVVQRRKRDVLRREMKHVEPQYGLGNPAPESRLFETRLKRAAMAANEADSRIRFT